MAKIFYIAMVDADTTQAFFFNNKKKALEKGMELYGGFGEFSFDLDGEEFEGDYATTYIYSGIENVNEGFLFYREDGRPHFEDMYEVKARELVEDGSFEDAMGGYFLAKLRSGYGEIYMSSAVEGTNELWTFEADELYENKKTMKYLPTFESFLNEYSTIVDSNKMLKALKKAVKAADSFEEIGDELEDLDYKKDYKWEFVEDFKGTDVGGHPAYIITYLQGTRHAIADPGFWKNSSSIEDKVGDLAIGWILGR